MNKDMNSANDRRAHDLHMTARKSMQIGGVCEVISFDDTCLVIKTVCGEMTVEGKEIKVGVLDTDRGVVSLDGKIDAIYYSDTESDDRRGFFGRLKK